MSSSKIAWKDIENVELDEWIARGADEAIRRMNERPKVPLDVPRPFRYDARFPGFEYCVDEDRYYYCIQSPHQNCILSIIHPATIEFLHTDDGADAKRKLEAGYISIYEPRGCPVPTYRPSVDTSEQLNTWLNTFKREREDPTDKEDEGDDLPEY